MQKHWIPCNNLFRPFKLLGTAITAISPQFHEGVDDKRNKTVSRISFWRRGEKLAIVPSLPWYFCLLDCGDLNGSTFLRTSAMGETSGMNPVGSTGMSFMASPPTSAGVVNVIGRDVVEGVVKV